MVRDNELRLNFEDDILRATCITHDGQVVHAPTRALVEAGQPASP
jgi:hypothetical protein